MLNARKNTATTAYFIMSAMMFAVGLLDEIEPMPSRAFTKAWKMMQGTALWERIYKTAVTKERPITLMKNGRNSALYWLTPWIKNSGMCQHAQITPITSATKAGLLL